MSDSTCDNYYLPAHLLALEGSLVIRHKLLSTYLIRTHYRLQSVTVRPLLVLTFRLLCGIIYALAILFGYLFYRNVVLDLLKRSNIFNNKKGCCRIKAEVTVGEPSFELNLNSIFIFYENETFQITAGEFGDGKLPAHRKHSIRIG